ITTYILLDANASLCPPDTWCSPVLWESRMVYTVLRTAGTLRQLMAVCPQWQLALEKHTFWDQACIHLDPYGTFESFRIVFNQASSAPPTRRSSFLHYERLRHSLCIVCRVNRPTSQCVLLHNENKREVWVPYFERIQVCRSHRRTSFCGACLRDTPPVDPRELMDEAADVGLATNQDVRSFNYVQTTCRRCRGGVLWRTMSTCSADREAVGGGPTHHWNAADLETRQAIELFVETGEGTLDEVVAIAREKHWLLKYTRVADFLEETVAAHRLSESMENPELFGTHRAEDELTDDLDVEDFEDLTMPEHLAQAREMAIHDWARTRVLEGHWVTPADDWYDAEWHPTPAEHPAPWTLPATDMTHTREQHPQPTLLRTPKAPTYALAENLYRVFLQQMRKILSPALCNVVRRIAMSASDPALYAARMEVQDVLHELHQPYAWSKDLGIGHLPPLPPPRRRMYKDKDDASSSSSHESHVSETETTSPVLSASTLQTTPSPPPREKLEITDTDAEVLTPLSPTDSDGVPPPDPANMMHAIPHIPVSLSRLPQQTAVLVQQVCCGV
ncbi:hypothetical protein K488DRAFT_43022, partial [Vararia minispora EC-137]